MSEHILFAGKTDLGNCEEGVVLPSLTTAERDALVSPINGTHIFNSSTGGIDLYNNGWGSTGSTSLASDTLLDDLGSYTFTGDLANYNPADLDTATGWAMDPNGGNRDFSGITVPASGTGRFILFNLGGGNIKLKHDDVTSTAANRFYCPNGGDLTIRDYGSVEVIYVTALIRWVVLGQF